MPNELDAGRLEGFFELVSDCAPLREYDSIVKLLAQSVHRLFEFERFCILLCDENRQILKTTMIAECVAREIPPDEIQLSEMDLILRTLISGETSSGSVGICTPMVMGGRVIGLLCFVSRCERYSESDARFLQFLAVILAGAFERIARDSITVAHDASVSQSHAVSLHMSYLAQHDALTDLPNRWLLNERLTRALTLSSRYKRRLAVLFLDLDRFKEVNDTMGHAMGDQVLRQISNRLVGCVRSSDTVSRIGGDEFVVLLAELENEKDALVCAEKIIAAVTAPLKVCTYVLYMTLSIGIGIYPGDGQDAETLIRNADAAMYHSKAEGRGRCHFFRKDMNAAASDQRLRV